MRKGGKIFERFLIPALQDAGPQFLS